PDRPLREHDSLVAAHGCPGRVRPPPDRPGALPDVLLQRDGVSSGFQAAEERHQQQDVERASLGRRKLAWRCHSEACRAEESVTARYGCFALLSMTGKNV